MWHLWTSQGETTATYTNLFCSQDRHDREFNFNREFGNFSVVPQDFTWEMTRMEPASTLTKSFTIHFKVHTHFVLGFRFDMFGKKGCEMRFQNPVTFELTKYQQILLWTICFVLISLSVSIYMCQNVILNTVCNYRKQYCHLKFDLQFCDIFASLTWLSMLMRLFFC